MTTPAKPAAPAAAKKTTLDHTDCYAAKLHAATPAGRSLCRAIRAEGKPLTKKSFADKKAAPKPTPAKKNTPSSEDAMINLSKQQTAPEAKSA